MSESISKLRTYIRWHVQRGISWIHGRGYQWFYYRFLPAIKSLEAVHETPEDRELLSDAYYYVGDVYDFNDAPLAAIRAYKKSIAYDPMHAEAYRELGCRYDAIGRYEKACNCLQHALEIEPDESYAQSDLEFATDNAKENTTPLYERESLSWKVNELFAQQKFATIQSVLDNHRVPYADFYRMNVFGALKQKANLLAVWQKIVTTHEAVEMRYQDWFYIDTSIWNSVVFWGYLLQGVPRFHYGVWPMHDSLNLAIPCPPNAKLGSPESLRSFHERLRCLALYNLARIRRDKNGAQLLSEKHPEWDEARELADKLQR